VSNRTSVEIEGTTRALCKWSWDRLYKAELSLRAAVRMSPDQPTAIRMADLAIRLQKRRHEHEGRCPVCLRREGFC
jgi:hypothetical protein